MRQRRQRTHSSAEKRWQREQTISADASTMYLWDVCRFFAARMELLALMPIYNCTRHAWCGVVCERRQKDVCKRWRFYLFRVKNYFAECVQVAGTVDWRWCRLYAPRPHVCRVSVQRSHRTKCQRSIEKRSQQQIAVGKKCSKPTAQHT